MFFTRSEREKVERLGERVTKLETEQNVLERTHKELLAAHTEAIKVFKKVSDQYTEGLQRARQTIEELNEIAQQPPTMRQQPLHMTEEEEDAQFALDAGAINLEEYNRIIREAGLAD